jgi:hypothetical protein
MNPRIKDNALFQSKMLPPPGPEWTNVEMGCNGDVDESKPMRNSMLLLLEQSSKGGGGGTRVSPKNELPNIPQKTH